MRKAGVLWYVVLEGSCGFSGASLDAMMSAIELEGSLEVYVAFIGERTRKKQRTRA